MADKSIRAVADIIGHSRPDKVREALMVAPTHIVEYLGQDKWFQINNKESDVPIYSQIAREILLERIVLGDAERK
jgi:hypothetical protein